MLDSRVRLARAKQVPKPPRPMIQATLPFPNIDPVLIHIYGPISIRWYALSYIAGLLLGWLYVLRLLKNKKLWAGPPFQAKPPATADDIGDLFVWITLGVIIGGRLGFVLLYGVFYCGFAGQGVPAWCSRSGCFAASASPIFWPSPTSSPRQHPSVSFSAALPISSTANCGE